MLVSSTANPLLMQRSSAMMLLAIMCNYIISLLHGLSVATVNV